MLSMSGTCRTKGAKILAALSVEQRGCCWNVVANLNSGSSFKNVAYGDATCATRCGVWKCVSWCHLSLTRTMYILPIGFRDNFLSYLQYHRRALTTTYDHVETMGRLPPLPPSHLEHNLKLGAELKMPRSDGPCSHP